ncbi:penicillin-binding protein 2 [Naumannella sp. ID2617S]|nr:penicillin-binding protein 2 [Naumannella sp. ID2617S]
MADQPRRRPRTSASTGRAAQQAGARRRPAQRRPSQRRPATGRRPAAAYRPPLRIPLGRGDLRIRVALIVMAIVVSVCAGRLLQLQAFDSKAYAAKAAEQMTRTVAVPASRGTITDRNGAVLADTAAAVLVTADPTLINDPRKNRVEEVADLLVRHVGGTREDYRAALTKPDTRYSVVARKVPAAAYHRLAQDLSAARIYGVFRESDPIRTYPEKSSAAAVVGFVGADSKGQGGIEYSMNRELSGTAGKEMYEASPSGYRIPLGANMISPASNGNNYQLTLDTELQMIAERKLAQAVEEAKAKSGTAITINIKTGEVLAMANVPTFDANNAASARSEDLFNRAVTQAYEPGSVQKVLTLSALMDAGLIAPDTRLVVPPSLKSGDGVIKDVWAHGYANVTARGVLAYSSNIGTIMMTRKMDTPAYREALSRFGLGQPTGIELPGEATGFLPPADMPGYTRDQIAFGQGLSVTAIQNAAAIAGILNGGVYNPPTIIKSATDADGHPIAVPRKESRRIVSEQTSKSMSSMMESVVGPGGFAQDMNFPEYRLGAKTGTSEVYNTQLGRYDGYVSSFVNMAPAEDPQLLTYVVVDQPKAGYTGGAIAGPVAYDVMRVALPRYGVLPSTGKRPTESELTWR